jgi:hypothetical protein
MYFSAEQGRQQRIVCVKDSKIDSRRQQSEGLFKQSGTARLHASAAFDAAEAFLLKYKIE